jgi:hypothetical protein
MWRIRRIIRRTKNLLRWLPIIWKDEQWDHYYIFEILRYKLIIMSETIRKTGNHTMADYDADRMMLCARLMKKVQDEEYLFEFIGDDEITREQIDKGVKKHDKAKRILFKLLDQYIERWWD